MPSKKQSVHLEDGIHKKIKRKALDDDSTIENVVNEILKKEFKNKKNDKNE